MSVQEMTRRNIELIRRISDSVMGRELLTARRDFLAVKLRHEPALAKIYLDAADRVAKQLRSLSPTVGQLTRNHLEALDKALRKEADTIYQKSAALIKTGLMEVVEIGARPIDNFLIRALKEADAPIDFLRLQRGFADLNKSAVEAFWLRTRQGLAISDRIWEQAESARQAMRDIIHAGITSGRDAVQVAKDLEVYVRNGTLAEDYPNMMARMERRVPGNLSYEALRLARTEYGMAFNESVYSRGTINPAYLGVQYMLSDSHPEPDICDDLASADLYGLGPGVYKKGEEPTFPHPNCYDEVTEVYTDEGWKLFKDLHGSEQILSMNPKTQEMEWVGYDAYVSYHFTGKMISFKTNSYDLLVTPDHRMLAGVSKWFITSAKELLDWEGSVFKLPRTGVWKGVEPKVIKYGGLEFEPEVFCKFMGYYLADGCTTPRYDNCYQICIAKTGEGKQKIIDDLANMPTKVSVGQMLYMYHFELGQELVKLGKSYEKHIPDEIMGLSPRLIKVFLDAFRHCDGHDRETTWEDKKLASKEKIYFTTSKKMADQLGELIVKAGYFPSYYLQKSKGKQVEFSNGTYTMNHDLWRISQNNSKNAWYHRGESKGLKVEEVDYDGMVYDVQLERNHILWVRRNGKTAWSGNCLCYVVPVTLDREEFVDDLIRWQKNPSSVDYLEDWYNNVYRQIV